MKKRLKRSQENKMIAGVLSGMAIYFKQDPTVFRLVAIIFLIVTGIFPGVLFYLAAWVLMPPAQSNHADYEM